MLHDLLFEVYRPAIFMFNPNYNSAIYNIPNFLRTATKTQKGHKNLLAGNPCKRTSPFHFFSRHNAK